uniref:Uncharacterized protein n=1 Tax=Anguilla anguilla TaxID=7936 RepID=A0A0E9VC96_ANGAN
MDDGWMNEQKFYFFSMHHFILFFAFFKWKWMKIML